MHGNSRSPGNTRSSVSTEHREYTKDPDPAGQKNKKELADERADFREIGTTKNIAPSPASHYLPFPYVAMRLQSVFRDAGQREIMEILERWRCVRVRQPAFLE
jgi:hypothetical protein